MNEMAWALLAIVVDVFVIWLAWDLLTQAADITDLNWFWAWRAAWTFEVIVGLFIVSQIVILLWKPARIPHPSWERIFWELMVLGAVVATQAMAIVNIQENDATIPWPVVFIPTWLLLLAFLVVLGYNTYYAWKIALEDEEAESPVKLRLLFLWAMWVMTTTFFLLVPLWLQRTPYFPFPLVIVPLFGWLAILAIWWWRAWRYEDAGISTIFLVFLALTWIAALVALIFASIQWWVPVLGIIVIVGLVWLGISIVKFLITRSFDSPLRQLYDLTEERKQRAVDEATRPDILGRLEETAKLPNIRSLSRLDE